jgi:uncharacterized protein (DUF736 family)
MNSNSQNNQNEWKNREVGALWKKTATNGKSSYCTGYIVSDELGSKVKQRVIMFANKTKSNEKSPDYSRKKIAQKEPFSNISFYKQFDYLKKAQSK